MLSYYLFVGLVCTAAIILVVELVRRKHLREKYAITWFIILFLLIIVSFNEDMITRVSEFVGIKYPPSFVFIIAILGLLLLNLMLSVIDSHQTERIISLAQRIAILEEKINNK